MLTAQAGHFLDREGRVTQLRGVNLSGSSKVPTLPNGTTRNQQGFYDTHNVSFVGRPFPLSEARDHLARLKTWGMNCLRLLVTWEAIEHSGPGSYDQAYLDYLYQVVILAAEHDLYIIIDPHQDVWSRFSGGDGAPGWTFELLGMDIKKFHATGAAFTHQEHGDPLPHMSWVGNYGKYACATLFTLFFGGNTFAPETRIAGLPAQDFLQSHYFAAIQQVAKRLHGIANVLGYETLNEPSPGYIGYPNLNLIGARHAAYGPIPTLYQGMLLAAGYPQNVRNKPSQVLPFTRRTWLNREGISIWHPGYQPIWQLHHVWDTDRQGRPQLLQPAYFNRAYGQAVNFEQDFFAPFVADYARHIRAVDPSALIFVSPPPPELATNKLGFSWPGIDRVVYAPHWYDGVTLATRRYLPWLGIDASHSRLRFIVGHAHRRRLFARLIQSIAAQGEMLFNGSPVVIGETGIPFNLRNSRRERPGFFSAQTQALDDIMQALETNCVSFTLWNYTPDNTNTHGDLWNGEDFSVFSRSGQFPDVPAGDIYTGGRALPAVIRPYATRTPGLPLETCFDLHSRRFKFSFRHDPSIMAPLEIFLPAYHYAAGVRVDAPGGSLEVNLAEQSLRYFPDPGLPTHTIIIQPA